MVSRLKLEGSRKHGRILLTTPYKESRSNSKLYFVKTGKTISLERVPQAEKGYQLATAARLRAF